MGCGIGCGAVLVIVIILGVTAFFYFRGLVKGFEESDVLMDTIREKYGEIEDYCPEPDGRIKPERINTFLAVRESLKPFLEEIEKNIKELERGRSRGEVEVELPKKNVFQMIGLGFGLVPKLADFLKARNQTLLEKGMGAGEYVYLYVTVYYSWLGKSPGEGPDITIKGEEGFQWEDTDDRELRRDFMVRQINRMILPLLKNQLEKMESGQFRTSGKEWPAALKAEIEALEEDRYRLPWQDGLPSVTEESLRPFRTRLEESFNPVINSLELTFDMER